MGFYKRTHSRDPSRINDVLEQMCEELRGTLGAGLESVVLYGNLVRSGQLETELDHVNVMIVLQQTGYQVLDRCVAAIEKTEKEIPLGIMVLTKEDLRSSCDVFPIKFHAMQQHHEVLFGEDVLSEIEVSDEHLRLRCEQQLKNLMLRMRSLYLHRSQSEHQLISTLNAVCRDLLSDLHACLYLKTGFVPEEDADLAALFAIEFGLPTKVVREIAELPQRSQAAGLDELKKIYDRLMTLVYGVAKSIDELEVQP